MRLVILNPHVRPIGKIVAAQLLGRRSLEKYGFILDHFLRHPQRPAAFLVDGTISSFNTVGLNWPLFPKFFIALEVWAWMLLNRVNPLRHPLYFSPARLAPHRDIILAFAKSTLDGYRVNRARLGLHQYRGLTLVHLSHYFKGTSRIAASLQRLPHARLIAESNLRHSPYFRRHFGERDVYTLPFVVRSRYRKLRPFRQRKNKCLAIGSVINPKGEEYTVFYGTATPLHPLRHEIYQHAADFRTWIDSYLVRLDNSATLRQKFAARHGRWRAALEHVPLFVFEKALATYHRQYFGYDIVSKYNEYRMFLSPEEITGLPSINAFEGMACGTALVAINHPMYTELGLAPDVHYVAYPENDVAALKEKLSYYQQHETALSRIAARGHQLVTATFTAQRIADRFWQDMEQLLAAFQNDPQAPFRCSFVTSPLSAPLEHIGPAEHRENNQDRDDDIVKGSHGRKGQPPVEPQHQRDPQRIHQQVHD